MRVTPAKVTPDTPIYPPADEVAALWAACRRVDDPGVADPAVRWLENYRALNCRELADLDLMRLMPMDPDAHRWPAWIPLLGMDLRAWLALYRLAVPLYSPAGELRALRFRAVDRVREPDPDAPGRLQWRVLSVDAKRKAVAARGFNVRGLMLADPPALAMLRGARGDGWDGERVVICEGEPDTWTAATVARRDAARWREGGTWATLGVIAGSWTAELAARIPNGAKVAVCTHGDDAGDDYAERIRKTLAGRCAVLRRPSTDGGRDDGEG